MTKRLYLKAVLMAASPLKLSSGDGWATDADVVVDAQGTPFIPGTTLAGIMRHYLQRTQGSASAKRWFGCLGEDGTDDAESAVKVYEAFPLAGAAVSARDGVALDEFKTARVGAKYDYQVVDAGASFLLRLEIDDESGEARQLAEALLQGFASGDICVGGKTSRGFGRLQVSQVSTLELDFENPADVEAYVAFSWGKSLSADAALEAVCKPQDVCSQLCNERRVFLEVDSFLMVRDYSTTAKAGNENKLVDAETLKGADGRPVLPGSSWAGAFRAHMYKILRRAGMGDGEASAFLSRVYGCVEPGAARKSQVSFSESVVEGARQMNRTRNAVDRFTGGAADKRLFTNRLSVGGTLELVIRWPKSMEPDDARRFESLLDACIDDLQHGYLAVGGMTAVGGGIMRPASSEKRSE